MDEDVINIHIEPFGISKARISFHLAMPSEYDETKINGQLYDHIHKAAYEFCKQRNISITDFSCSMERKK